MDIIIKNLSKSYGRVCALSDVNLSITPGIHGLLGPNGAGKTTLMRILATILAYDEGEIKWGDAFTWKHPMAIKGKVGYLPQQFGMYRYLRVEEALRNVALLKNIPKAQEKEHVERAMERTNLTEYAKRKVGQLSGGMLRRLGIAQAILGEPSLLIMDEPSVGLDPKERINFRKLIREYDNGERVILISSHIVTDVESLCEKVSIMNLGKVLVSGSMPEIQAKAGHHVKEEIMSEEAMKELENTHTVINFTPVDSGYRVRYLTDDDTQENAINSTLEDSYTYIIQRNQTL
ncbi:Vitamin B12 import ATP-binding protein BtuD [bioreactor metagenome]|uniref:Vitamin B12 import ATP-binding protein BtuD n=1 Tax=bioreactor metagenome TaxID=1076179 RepID=A0A645EJC1_9ZZZZ|nr:ABC transporter ATP-binding protein [Oscillospiraceae bacterium]